MTADARWNSLQRRRNHCAYDRCITLAKQGLTDDQIADETQLPFINVRAITAEFRSKQPKDKP
jgi:hypothetical protein